MGKKPNIMSLSLDSEIQEKLKLFAKQKTNGNVSRLVRDLANKYLIADDDVIPIILKLPVSLKGDRAGLEEWLKNKFSAIVNALSAE